MEHDHMLARREDLAGPVTTSTASTSTSTSTTNDPGPPPPLPVLHPSLPNPSTLPPSYAQAASASVHLPDVPTTDLPLPRPRAASQNESDNKLPALTTVASALRGEPSLRGEPQWLVLNPMLSHRSPPQTQLPSMDSPLVVDMDAISNGTLSAASPDRFLDARASSVSLDDPDVRLAAEALGDLRADFVSSPPQSNVALPPITAAGFQTTSSSSQAPEEPLLSLLTTSHPLLATTIEGATSAYGGAKNFSPRFKSSAEYVEGYLTPIANTVGSVGRVTGVEGSVRWFLGAGRRHGSSSSDLESGATSNKRRKVQGGSDVPIAMRLDADPARQQMAIEAASQQQSVPATPKGDRRLSMASTIDSLPAYDDMRTPAYTETNGTSQESAPPAAWQSRLIMSTSGLSIAMSKESLRSLKYCLSWLRWSNSHISRVIGALKDTLDQYDRVESMDRRQGIIGQDEKGIVSMDASSTEIVPREESRSELAARINSLKNDVLKTLQDVISTVSKYAGGALPENARILVRRHLTSLPQRFHVATMSDSTSASRAEANDGDSAMRDGAHKILVLAKEGLDIIVQVSGVLDGTIVSAEEWCERMGRKRGAERPSDDQKQQPHAEPYGDVKMG